MGFADRKWDEFEWAAGDGFADRAGLGEREGLGECEL